VSIVNSGVPGSFPTKKKIVQNKTSHVLTIINLVKLFHLHFAAENIQLNFPTVEFIRKHQLIFSYIHRSQALQAKDNLIFGYENFLYCQNQAFS
jgi:hypothetical protein